jgi:methanogenic corrinoid protein MtbC1
MRIANYNEFDSELDADGFQEETTPADQPTGEAGSLTETPLFQHYVSSILAGDRPACRRVVEQAAECGVEAEKLLLEICWPAAISVRQLYRDSKISLAAEHMASRLNRATVDRLTGQLPMRQDIGRRALICCGGAEGEELGGQLVADLFEASGFEVKFLGGGVPHDEVNHMIGLWRPHLAVMFATLPTEMPEVRKLIDHLREHGSVPNLQVMCCGGIYERAPGLAEEVGADLVAGDLGDAVEVAISNPTRKATAQQQTVGRHRRDRVAREKEQQRSERRLRRAA